MSYSRITLSQVLWITGRSQEALAEAEAALAHARTINHANTIGMAMLYVMLVRQQRGEREAVAALGRETSEYCERMGVTTPSSYATLVTNWALRDVATSLGVFEVHAAIGAHLGMTPYCSLAVENALDAGDAGTAEANPRAGAGAGGDDGRALLAAAVEAAGGAGGAGLRAAGGGGRWR